MIKVYCYDSETTNIPNALLTVDAYPVLHQLGALRTLENLTPDNIKTNVDISMYRHTTDVIDRFNGILSDCVSNGDSALVLVHNLGFDIQALYSFFCGKNCQITAKGNTKPIMVSIKGPHCETIMTILDTEGLFNMSLEACGKQVGLSKQIGKWDYDKVRTPFTPLTDDEIDYAKHDVYVLALYFAVWLKLRGIPLEEVGKTVLTSTGVVRYKRLQMHGSKQVTKRTTVQQQWYLYNKQQAPKNEKEYSILHACTRGGLTFLSTRDICKIHDYTCTDKTIYCLDATSQHPTQMLSKVYPVNMVYTTAIDYLTHAVKAVLRVREADILRNIAKPYPYAFDIAVQLDNIRLKSNTPYSDKGIAILSQSRFSMLEESDEEGYQNSDKTNELRARGYMDAAIDPVFIAGKLHSAKAVRLFITEIELWLIAQVYEFSAIHVLDGMITSKFAKPTTLSLLSVLSFYLHKNAFKHINKAYKDGTEVSDVDIDTLRDEYPETMLNDLKHKRIPDHEREIYYLAVKAELNALYGIEVTNEIRVPYALTNTGISKIDKPSFDYYTTKPKTCIQYGQRIVGYSRLAQILHINMISRCGGNVLYGDTDSVYYVADPDTHGRIMDECKAYGTAVYTAASIVCDGLGTVPIGLGVYDVDKTLKRIMFSNNKHYMYEKDGKVHCVIAGLTTHHAGDTISSIINRDYNPTMWQYVCNRYGGFNVTLTPNISHRLISVRPKDTNKRVYTVTDYTGKTYTFAEYSATALTAAGVVLLSTKDKDIATMCKIAQQNNPDINTKEYMIG